MASSAATWYVDANNGDDDWNGSVAEAAVDVAVSKNGPKKTLAAALKDRASGDVVIALPGTYAEGVSNPENLNTGNTLNRVRVPSGVTLKSRDGAENTIILGAAANDNPDSHGCGTNAVRCASVAGRLIGFTLTGGRTGGTIAVNKMDNENSGAAAIGGGPFVDCIISNNYAVYGGGGGYYSSFVRCRFLGNNGAGKSLGPAMTGNTATHCLFRNDNVYQSSTYGCTFANSGAYPRSGKHYNAIVRNMPQNPYGVPTFYNSIVAGASGYTANIVLEDGSIATNAAAIAMQNDGSLGADSVAIDAGNADYLSLLALEWRDADITGAKRIANGKIDVGCVERDWYGEYSEALSPRGAAEVTNATSYVKLSGESLDIPTNGAATVLLKPFNDAESLYSFFAEVTGSGTLSVYIDGSDTPAYTFTSVDGLKETKFLVDAVKSARFAYSGEDGHAAISRFSNVTAFAIEAAQNGIAVSGGISMGTTYVGGGETVSFTVTRAYDSDVVCLGINANGTFMSFDDNPGGMSFTVDGDDRTMEVAIEAVYKTGLRDWYVDANGGSDANTGLYTNNAFKTLKAAVLNPRRATGEVIYALPGVYQDGVCTNSFWLGSQQWDIYSRAYLDEKTVLKSLEGPEKTFIVGAKSMDPSANNGCGEGAVRCLYMRADSWLEGFTLTGGYSPAWDSNNSHAGGAAYFNGAGAIVDCIVSNNYANCGGALSGGYIYRSRIYRNGGTLGTDAYNSTRFVNCYILNDRGSIYCMYSGCKAYNCTFGPNGQGPRNGTVYNSILLNSSYSSSCNTKFYNCVMVGKPPDASSELTDCTNVPAASLRFDKFMRPKSGSVAIDYGSWDNYLSVTNTLMTIEKISQDLYGGERVAGGGIDAGCGEFDVRLLPGFLIKIW